GSDVLNSLLRLLRCGWFIRRIKAFNPFAQAPSAIRGFAIRRHHGNYQRHQHQNTDEDQPKTAWAHGLIMMTWGASGASRKRGDWRGINGRKMSGRKMKRKTGRD